MATDYISRAELYAAFCKASAPAFDNHGKATFIVDYVKVLEAIPAADVVPMDFHERCLQIEIQKRMALEKADVRPIKRGKWIDRDDKYYGWNMWACSACGEEFVLTEGTPDMNGYRFCPNCGADMRTEEGE